MSALWEEVQNLKTFAKDWKIYNFSVANSKDLTDEIGFNIKNSTTIFLMVKSANYSGYSPTYQHPTTSDFTINVFPQNNNYKAYLKRQNNRILYDSGNTRGQAFSGYIILMN